MSAGTVSGSEDTDTTMEEWLLEAVQSSSHASCSLQKAAHEDGGAFCTCREGAQKVSVKGLVRDDE